MKKNLMKLALCLLLVLTANPAAAQVGLAVRPSTLSSVNNENVIYGLDPANNPVGNQNLLLLQRVGDGTKFRVSSNGNTEIVGNLNVTGTISGTVTNADTVDGVHAASLFNNMGSNHSTYTDFNSPSDFGYRYIQGTANGPGNPGAAQYYNLGIGLGNDYSYGQYAMQLAIPRDQGATRYLNIRTREGGTWQAWTKAAAGYADSAGSASNLTCSNCVALGSETSGAYDSTDDAWSGNSFSNTASINNSYPLVMGSDGMLKVKSLATVNGSETVSLQTSIDGRTDDYTIGSYGGEGRHLLVLQPQGGYVGIGKTDPGAKLDISGSLVAGGVDNGSVIFYRSSNPYSIGNTDSVLTVSDRSNADWGITADKTGFDYGMRINVASGATYALATYNGSSYPFRVDGTGKTFLPEISHSNGRVYLAGNLHIDSYNGNQIYMNHYSSANTMVGTGGGNLYVGSDSPPSAYRIYGTTSRGSDWGYRFDNSYNGSNVHIAHGGGYGLHVNAGSNASSGTYLLELYSANGIGQNAKMTVTGAGAVGIGTATPRVGTGAVHALDVSGTGSMMEVRGGSCSSVTQGLSVKAACTGDAANGFGTGINLGISDPGMTCGYGGMDCNYVLGRVNVVRNGGDQTGDMYFMTANGGSPTEKMRIAAGGTVSIGANGMSYLCGGDDACLNDVNAANTVGIVGKQNSSVGAIRLGSGATLTGNSDGSFTLAANRPHIFMNNWGSGDSGIGFTYDNGMISRIYATNNSHSSDPWLMLGTEDNTSMLQIGENDVYMGGPLYVSGNLNADIIYSGNDLRMSGSSPTTYYLDWDNRSSMIHVNSNIFYVLRGCGTGDSSWCTYNGKWPLELNLENNTATFGGGIDVTANGVKSAFGSSATNYLPASSNWNYTIQLNGLDYSSIGFHDASSNVGSIRFRNNNFYIGYDDGWGTAYTWLGGGLTTGGNINTNNISTWGDVGIHMDPVWMQTNYGNYGLFTDGVYISQSGNPYGLYVGGTVRVSGKCEYYNGSVWTDGGYTSYCQGIAYDIAELISVPKDELIEAGDVIVAGEREEYGQISSKSYDSRVIGVYSTAAAIVFKEDSVIMEKRNYTGFPADKHNGEIPLALSGRVPVKVTDENGDIKAGDLLTTASLTGHAMKFSLVEMTGEETMKEFIAINKENERRRNSILGKALEDFTADKENPATDYTGQAAAEGWRTGKIMTLVTLQ